MNFIFTEEQTAIRDMALSFARVRMAPHAAAWEDAGTLPLDVLGELGGLGMGTMFISEADGGSAMSRLDGVLVFEALSHGCPAVAAFVSIHNMAAALIAAAGSPEQRRRWLPGLASMETLASYCLTEPGAGSDAAAIATRAVRDGDDYVLNGTKQFISGAGLSGLYVTMARTGGAGFSGITAFAIEKDTPGLSFGPPERKMGWGAQPTCSVVFDDARVPAANRLGVEGDGFRFAMRALDGGRINIAACSIGAASAACEKALGYMGERRAFGAPLSDLQALRFKIADMAT